MHITRAQVEPEVGIGTQQSVNEPEHMQHERVDKMFFHHKPMLDKVVIQVG